MRGSDSPWWQIAGLQDPAIQQPPAFGLRRGPDESVPPRFEVGMTNGGSGSQVEAQRYAETDRPIESNRPIKTNRPIDASEPIEAERHPNDDAIQILDATATEQPYDNEGADDVLADDVLADAGLSGDAAWTNKASGPMQLPSVLEVGNPPQTALRPEGTDTWGTMIDAEDSPLDLIPPRKHRGQRPNRLPLVPWEFKTGRRAPYAEMDPTDDVADGAANGIDGHSYIPFEFESSITSQGKDGEEVVTVVGDRSPLSTLSKQEQAAFAKIWNEIMIFNHRPCFKVKTGAFPRLKQQTQKKQAENSEPMAAAEEPDWKEDAKEDAENLQSTVKFLVKDAAYLAKQGETESHTLVDQMRNAKYCSQVLQQYPMSVRQVAIKALGLQKVPSPREGQSRLAIGGDPSRKSPSLVLERAKAMGVVDNHVEKLRQEEWVRLRDLITDTKTDRDLWDVLEEHVFSIPARLGIEEEMEKHKVKATAKTLVGRIEGKNEGKDEDRDEEKDEVKNEERVEEKDEVKDEEKDEENDKGTHEPITENKIESTTEITEMSKESTSASRAEKKASLPRLSIDVYGPIYPALLIVAHRQLVRNFEPTSPLVFQLLPRVKSLGLVSYVLGASTTLYNETISLWWTHRGDLRAVLSILDEMEAAGMYADSHTEKLLDRINVTLRVCQGDAGGWSGFVPSMMRMGGFAEGMRRRLAHAHNRVRESVVQRGIQLLA